MPSDSRQRPWLGGLLRIAGSGLILYLLFRFVPVSEAWQTMKQLPSAVWVVVLAAYLSVHSIGIGKYRLVLNSAGAGLNYAQAARCYFAGLFGMLFLPSVIGGDLVKAGLALRLAKSQAGVLLGTLIDRLIDVAALLTLAGLGLALIPAANEATGRLGLEIGAGILAAACIVAVTTILLLPARRFSWRMRRRIVRLREAARSTTRQPRRMATAYGMSLCVQLGFISLTIVLADASGLHLPTLAWLYAWPLAKISALLPVSQGGIGVREAALAGLLAPLGARAAVVVGVGLAWEAVVMAGALISGGISLAIGRIPAGQSRSLNMAGKSVPS